MSVQKLERTEWHAFFDRLMSDLLNKRAEVEVTSLAHGHQVVASWLPLLGIVYDPKNDLIEISLEGLDHMVRRPRELYVDGPLLGWASLAVIDGDAVLQIVKLRDPLMLPEHSA
jgi:hypothetical protein